jgi:nicotinamide-nucleotide amidase
MIETFAVDLAEQAGQALTAKGWRLISTESCTGGLLAATLTEIAGSSDWFEGAFVTYRLTAKTTMVGVSSKLLDTHGAVSEPVARAMAEGALANSKADIAVSITGVAGPGGGDVVSPVGTVWFGFAIREDNAIRCVQTAEHHLSGNRRLVRQQAVNIALEGVLALC